jgi:hypothetical protein
VSTRNNALFAVLYLNSCVQEMEGFLVKRDKLTFFHINGNQRIFNGFDQSVGQRKYPTETPSAYQQIGGFFASPVGDSISVWQRKQKGRAIPLGCKIMADYLSSSSSPCKSSNS